MFCFSFVLYFSFFGCFGRRLFLVVWSSEAKIKQEDGNVGVEEEGCLFLVFPLSSKVCLGEP